MATNIGPIILGLGAAFLLMRKKDESQTGLGRDEVKPGDPWGGDPGGTTACHTLDGIWASPSTPEDSPMGKIDPDPDSPTYNQPYTQKNNLKILPLTIEAFVKARKELVRQFNLDERPDVDLAVFAAEKDLTSHLDCPWGKPSQWTPRMKNVHDALVVLYAEIIDHNTK